MSTISRMSGPRGPRFYDNEGELTFVLVLDGNTRHGPFPATDQHMAEHPDAYRQYMAEKAREAQGMAPDDFPGRPLIKVEDPPGGPPPERTPKARGPAKVASGSEERRA